MNIVAASDELKLLNLYVGSFGYGLSTVVDAKGADVVAVTWEGEGGRRGEIAQLTWSVRHPSAVRSRSLAHNIDRVCNIRETRTNSYLQRTKTIAPKPWSCRKLSDTVAGTSTYVARRTTRPHRRMTAH